jgi:hypothetical protein
MQLPDLNDLLTYENPAVLKLYEQNYPKNILPAKDAFREILKYLWLSAKHKLDQAAHPDDPAIPARCVMLRSMREIDEMWHEFILFTKDYTNFCQHYFGEYLHHLPNIFDNLPTLAPEEETKEIQKLLPYIYDQLGEDTVRIWFATYLTS